MNVLPAAGLRRVVLSAAVCSGCAVLPMDGPWSDPQLVKSLNTPGPEGCPIESPDGLALYIASGRAASSAQGKLDIYRARRAAVDADWGAPENLGPVVNSAELDYCPTPLADRELLFVSSRQTSDDCHPGDTPPPPPGGPSAGDMVRTREDPARGWLPVMNLGCYPNGPNTAGAEYSPSLVRTAQGTFLFFSSNGYRRRDIVRPGRLRCHPRQHRRALVGAAPHRERGGQHECSRCRFPQARQPPLL